MNKRTETNKPHILLIDDQIITTMLILRLFNYLNFEIYHIKSVKQMKQCKNTVPFNLVVTNLASSYQEESWIPQYMKLLKGHIPVIYYTPDLLIDDFERAFINNKKNPNDDSWLINSELYRFCSAFIPL